MSRPWTGWVLTAAAITAGPATAPGSNSSPQARQTIVAQADVLPPAGGHADCLEVTTPRAASMVRGGDVVVLKNPYPTSKANGDLRLDKGTLPATDEPLRSAIERSKGAGSGEAARWLLLPEGKLVPQGAVQPIGARAACGIPRGLTLLMPTGRPKPPAVGG